MYWRKPSQAAKRLMELVERGRWEGQYRNGKVDKVTEAEVRKALVPIKAFRTKQGADFEIEEIGQKEAEKKLVTFPKVEEYGNKQRVERAYKAVEQYTDFRLEPSDMLGTYTGDMLANLMHMCDHYGIDFEDALRRGRMHYEAEKTEEVTA